MNKAIIIARLRHCLGDWSQLSGISEGVTSDYGYPISQEEFEAEQVKPVVIGYRIITRSGHAVNCAFILSSAQMKHLAKLNLENYGIKSKFRPVYAKRD